jgi:hypothetical protein
MERSALSARRCGGSLWCYGCGVEPRSLDPATHCSGNGHPPPKGGGDEPRRLANLPHRPGRSPTPNRHDREPRRRPLADGCPFPEQWVAQSNDLEWAAARSAPPAAPKRAAAAASAPDRATPTRRALRALGDGAPAAQGAAEGRGHSSAERSEAASKLLATARRVPCGITSSDGGSDRARCATTEVRNAVCAVEIATTSCCAGGSATRRMVDSGVVCSGFAALRLRPRSTKASRRSGERSRSGDHNPSGAARPRGRGTRRPRGGGRARALERGAKRSGEQIARVFAARSVWHHFQ